MQISKPLVFSVLFAIGIGLLIFFLRTLYRVELFNFLVLASDFLVIMIFVASFRQAFDFTLAASLGILFLTYLKFLLLIPIVSNLDYYYYSVLEIFLLTPASFLSGWLFFGNYLNPILFAFSPLIPAFLNFAMPRNVPFLTPVLQFVRSLFLLQFVLINAPVAIPAIWIVTIWLYRYERGVEVRGEAAFRRNRPFFFFGTVISEAELAFAHASNCAGMFFDTIRKTAEAYPYIQLEQLSITDIAAKPKYSKIFLKARSHTPFQTQITFMFNTTPLSHNVYFKWWVLLQGRVHFWDVLRFILLSPLSFPFWIYDWLNHEYSIVATLSGEIKHSYDILDIEALVVSFQQDFYRMLVQDLEAAGVDVSLYKENPPNLNVMNINGSGNVVGAVAQGSASRASARVAAKPA